MDDEEQIRRMLHMILRNNGYEVITASNGTEALIKYEGAEEKINLVLTDIAMPEMDGVMLSHKLKALNPTVRIVVASGRYEKKHRPEFINLGVKEFLTKPFRMNELLKSVHEGIYEMAS